jgi:2-polyprenyl-3-methyl-5-hydroxy-6-metoxy-1,4-benzoquinol methylase
MTRTRATTASYTGPREDVVALIPPGAGRILDVGCSDGTLGAGLRARGAEVWGIEYDPDFASVASARLDRVLQGDAATVVRELEDEEPFDVVICADVLEHLADPAGTLQGIRGLLTADGRCIVSLPNVRFYTTFVELALRGRWPRKDRGVHDRTHLSWFTDLDAREMFAAAGFAVEEARAHYRLADLPHHPRNRYARLFARGPLRPFLAYQYLYRLRPA